MGRRRTAGACAGAAMAALLASCGADPVAPSPGATLRLTAAIAQPTVTRDHPVALTFQLENTGTQSVTLNFPSSCQINPYILDGTGRIVYPAGGNWACATVITSVQLAPGGVTLVSFLVEAADTSSAPTPGAVSLAAGQYSAYATVNANEIQLRSSPVAFTVQ